MMESDGRARPTLSASLVGKLMSCSAPLGLSGALNLVLVIEALADVYLGSASAKRQNWGAAGAAERECVSDSALAGRNWDVTSLKHRKQPTEVTEDFLGHIDGLPDALKQLLLLVPEPPVRGSLLSRHNAVCLVLEGLRNHEQRFVEELQCEFSKLELLANDFSESISEHSDGLASLSASFAKHCPRLRGLFSELAIGHHAAANTMRTIDVKMESALIIASAIGKVRNQRNSSLARLLYLLWKSLGVPIGAINVLAGLGLSLSDKDGQTKLKLIVENERSKLSRSLMRQSAVAASCVVFDNIDFATGTKSFVQTVVDSRKIHHVTAASVFFLRDLDNLPAVIPQQKQRTPLAIDCLFADEPSQARIVASVCETLHRTLHHHNPSFLTCKTETPPPIVDFGSLERSRRQALPIFRLEEGKIDHMYCFAHDILSRYPPRSAVYFVGDCFSLQKLLAVRELLAAEALGSHSAQGGPVRDQEDGRMVLVPGFFHLYWNVFLGSLLQSDRDLLSLVVQICGLQNVKLHKNISSCFNDMDHLVTIVYPVVCARLYGFFRDEIADSLGLSLKDMREGEVMMRFTIFVKQTVQSLGDGPVEEWQRLCRVVLLLSVYRSLRVAIATEDHLHMVDVLKFSVTLVCQGPFSQYRKIIIESVAHLARCTDHERAVYLKCFTGNYNGGHLGGRAMDEIREFDNKATKESLRRTHRTEGDLAPELELTEQQRDVRKAFSSAFLHLDDGARGDSIPKLPESSDVLDWASRAQWPAFETHLCAETRKGQTPFFDLASHYETVTETLHLLHRSSQFFVRVQPDSGRPSVLQGPSVVQAFDDVNFAAGRLDAVSAEESVARGRARRSQSQQESSSPFLRGDELNSSKYDSSENGPQSDPDNDNYMIEEIVDHREGAMGREYRARYVGLGSERDEWFPRAAIRETMAEGVDNYEALLPEDHRLRPAKRGKRK